MTVENYLWHNLFLLNLSNFGLQFVWVVLFSVSSLCGHAHRCYLSEKKYRNTVAEIWHFDFSQLARCCFHSVTLFTQLDTVDAGSWTRTLLKTTGQWVYILQLCTNKSQFCRVNYDFWYNTLHIAESCYIHLRLQIGRLICIAMSDTHTSRNMLTHGLDGQHQRRGQDSPLKSQSERQRTEINGESIPWCSQPSDRGRLKNRAERVDYRLVSPVFRSEPAKHRIDEDSDAIKSWCFSCMFGCLWHGLSRLIQSQWFLITAMSFLLVFNVIYSYFETKWNKM